MHPFTKSKGAKRAVGAVALCLVAALCSANLSACAGKSTKLAAPPAAVRLSYEEEAGLKELRTSLDAFSAEFSAQAFGLDEGEGNFTVSPVTAYMALSMAAACTAGETREEILSALQTTYANLEAQSGALYRSLAARIEGNGMGQLRPVNSIWLDESVSFREECVETLAQRFYAYVYAADFAHDNKNANLAVRKFVKDRTKGLIDSDLRLPKETIFTLVSSLYLKDTWNLFGNDLPFTAEQYTFAGTDETFSTRLLQGYYEHGRAYEGEDFVHFFTETYHGFRLKFFLPKEGHTAAEIFTAENIAEVNAVRDYGADDDEQRIRYYTRCLFPEFTAAFDGQIGETLRALGIQKMFDPLLSDFSPLAEGPVFCNEPTHAAKLKVTKKGIEGAAVFVIPGAGAPGPDEYEEVYQDFVVDREFGFLLTDFDGVPLFSGVVKKL